MKLFVYMEVLGISRIYMKTAEFCITICMAAKYLQYSIYYSSFVAHVGGQRLYGCIVRF